MPQTTVAPEREIWTHRRLLATLIRRDLRSRYAGSHFGMAWVFVQPLVTIGLYVLVFSTLVRGGRFEVAGTTAGYAAYLLPGLLAWQWGNEVLSQSCGSIVGHGGLLRKVAFPATLLPLTQYCSSLIPFLVVLGSFCGLGVLAGWYQPLGLLLLPMIVLLHVVLLSGPVFLLASLTVFIRDLGQAVPTVLQALFWATPIVYTAEMVTGKFPAMAWFFALNPAHHIISMYREVLLLGRVPPLTSIAYLGLLAMTLYALGRWTFRRLRPVLADES
jgi:ABC-type polysaccharide/polyol phosphate export permease